jgi:hypothetical protein
VRIHLSDVEKWRLRLAPRAGQGSVLLQKVDTCDADVAPDALVGGFVCGREVPPAIYESQALVRLEPNDVHLWQFREEDRRRLAVESPELLAVTEGLEIGVWYPAHVGEPSQWQGDVVLQLLDAPDSHGRARAVVRYVGTTVSAPRAIELSLVRYGTTVGVVQFH